MHSHIGISGPLCLQLVVLQHFIHMCSTGQHTEWGTEMKHYCFVRQEGPTVFTVRKYSNNDLLAKYATRQLAEEYAKKYSDRRRRDEELEIKYRDETTYF